MPGRKSVRGHRWYSVILCITLVFSGVTGMLALGSLKENIRKGEPRHTPLAVSVREVQPETVPYTLNGYGELKASNEVTISSEISGTLVYVNPKLEAGEILSKGELLFQVDENRYLIERKKLDAAVSRIENKIKQLNIQQALNRDRWAIAKRNQDLYQAEYMRLKRLLYDHQVGSKSKLGAAEQQLNTAKDLSAQLSQTIQVYPYTLKQAQYELSEALAQLESTREDITHCKVYAPLDGRVKSVSIEAGQYVMSGQNIVTLVDDTVLEVNIAVDSMDIRRWLQFEDDRSPDKPTWFTGLKKVACKVYWAEDDGRRFWKGRLHRAIRYNSKTNTLDLAVRIDPNRVGGGNHTPIPIVEGMFCRVEIPGKTMRNVFRLPTSAVSMQKYVYLSNDHYLKTTPVEVIAVQGEDTFIRSGLNSGDRVIVSRLVNPIENTLLEIIPDEQGEHK